MTMLSSTDGAVSSPDTAAAYVRGIRRSLAGSENR